MCVCVCVCVFKKQEIYKEYSISLIYELFRVNTYQLISSSLKQSLPLYLIPSFLAW